MALPDFFIPKRKHIGLSIGRSSLRVVEVKDRGTLRTAEHILPEGVFDEGILVKKKEFGEALKKLLEKGQFSTSYVAVCFSEIYAFSREISLPVISLDEINEAVSWKVKDLFPFPEEEIYFDWKLLGTQEKEHQIVVIAVPKKILDPIIEALLTASLKPISFEPGATAITRLLVLKPEEQALLIEINRKGAYVTFVEGEKPIFTTAVNVAPVDTPETYLKNITQTIQEIANYYKKKGKIKTESTQVILSGEMVSEEWAKKFSENTKNPVKILKTQIANPAFNKAYAQAIATRTPPRDAHTINLLPERLQKLYDTERRDSFHETLLSRVLFVVAVLFIGSLSVFLVISLERQEREQKVKRLNQSKAQTSNSQNILLLNAQANNIVTLAPLRDTPRDKLSVIQSILPDGIVVTQWEYDDSKLLFTLTGIAKRRESLLLFKDKLEQTDEFTKVTLPLGSLEISENVRFSITFVSKK